MRKQQQTEDRRRLIGFIRTAFDFLNDRSSTPNAVVLQFDQIRWDDVPARGLRLAAADTIEWCQDVAGEPLTRLDATLAAKDLPTLTAMRDSQYRQAIGILARNTIRSEEEWQLLNRLVVDTASDVLSSAERDRVEQLLGQYRQR